MPRLNVEGVLDEAAFDDIVSQIHQYDPANAPLTTLLKFGFPDWSAPVNTDYEAAKDLIRECVYGDKWHQALKNKRTSRREHHRLGRSHRPKGAR